ncbi:phytoene desaturase family protein [Paraflavisolibacter sp. H34]|uniref:phytoene desaturase family protein n=1 Tax=Huijunlia imazamoxiresistens TaxID=3127457 RepID=UPI003016731C
MNKSVIIIGAGFAGLSAAAFMAKAGYRVTVVEKNATAGGRAARLQAQGFTFDMGPSWYWMPDVFDRFFAQFGKQVSDYYTLTRLDPSYRVYWPDGGTDIPAGYSELQSLFESIEPGSSRQLDRYLKEAACKYRVGVQHIVYKPGRSVTEFLDWQVLRNLFRLDVFTSMERHVGKYFRHYKLRQLMEFPVLFLGALPRNTPALYSLMNFADIVGGTWYPQGGMYSVVEAMHRLAVELGVAFRFGEEAREIVLEQGAARGVATDKGTYRADAVISGADYYFTEKHLLPPAFRSYPEAWWDKKVLAPSCLLYYVGIGKKLPRLCHHALFFDVPFDRHAGEIYRQPRWPEEPLFYVSAASVTDPSAAPEGCENLVLLIPVAAGLEQDTEALREHYFDKVVRRLEQHTGESIKEHVVYKKTFSVSDFVSGYNSYKGNAYGLANTLGQTAIFRPSCESKKVKRLFYTGQFTVPGPGVPPSLISGEVTSGRVLKLLN